MKKLYLTTGLLALLVTMGSPAKTISPEEALGRVAGAGMKAPALKGERPVLVHTALTDGGAPAVYVFNNANSGYMVLSADDIAYPVLGYSDKGTVDPAAMPEQMKWWMEEYARQIEWASANGNLANSTVRRAESGRKAIAPQLKTAWDQGAPYNNLAPRKDTERCYTGCVATAMAQVMNYWQYPEVGQGRISYNDDGLGKRLELDFSLRRFDWANMLPTYEEGKYTEEQASAVAYLMQAAGYSVKMSYGTDSSGALAMNTGRALTRYFKYDPNILYTLRMYYSATDWDRMMYDNLATVGPVLYGGASMIGGGHSFVCDGYDGQGYYHFNWGWSEMSDGYYSLDALNPDALGAGGGSGGGYNFTQDAVFGIQPPTGKPAEERPMQITQTGQLKGNLTGSKLKFALDGEGGGMLENSAMLINYNPVSVSDVTLGVIVESMGAETPVVKYVNLVKTIFNLQPGYGIDINKINQSLDLAALELADGDYKLILATYHPEEEGEDQDWQPVHPCYGYRNYVIVSKKGDEFAVKNVDAPDYEIKKAEFVLGPYIGCLAKVKVTLHNPTDYELSRGVAPMLLLKGQPAFLGESIFVTIQPGETVEREWETDLLPMSQAAAYISDDTEVQFTIFDESNYIIHTEFTQNITLKANPGFPQISLGRILINGQYKKGMMIDGKLTTAYKVSDPSEIKVTTSITMPADGGVFAYPVYAGVLSNDVEDNGSIAILATAGRNVFMTEAGQSTPFEATIHFGQGEGGKIYNFGMMVAYASQMAQLSSLSKIYIEPSLGIDDAAADTSALGYNGENVTAAGQWIEIYSLQGVKMAEGADSVSTVSLAPGVYIARTPAGDTLKITK